MRSLYVRSLPCGAATGNSLLRPRLLSGHVARRYRRVVFAAITATAPMTYHSPFAWKDDFNERYILEKSIGRGSFGEVWLAIDKDTRERVAVKEMPKKRGRLTAQGTFAKVDREICVMAELKSCPATVQLKECHALPNSYRIVMEYCAGLDLREQIKKHGPASEEVVACIACEILQILKRCHNKRIVHGDVKTANFILQSAKDNPFITKNVQNLRSGWLKAIDFGCSQYALDNCRISSRVGTPVFMAPEVFDRDYLFESDLWSLGIVLYQLISGRFPFWDTTETALQSSVQDVMEVVQHGDPDFANAPFDAVSLECLDFLQKLLDKDYTTRLTAVEALEHPFIQKYIASEDPSVALNNNIVPTATASLNAILTETCQVSWMGSIGRFNAEIWREEHRCLLLKNEDTIMMRQSHVVNSPILTLAG